MPIGKASSAVTSKTLACSASRCACSVARSCSTARAAAVFARCNSSSPRRLMRHSCQITTTASAMPTIPRDTANAAGKPLVNVPTHHQAAISRSSEASAIGTTVRRRGAARRLAMVGVEIWFRKIFELNCDRSVAGVAGLRSRISAIVHPLSTRANPVTDCKSAKLASSRFVFTS